MHNHHATTNLYIETDFIWVYKLYPSSFCSICQTNQDSSDLYKAPVPGLWAVLTCHHDKDAEFFVNPDTAQTTLSLFPRSLHECVCVCVCVCVCIY